MQFGHNLGQNHTTLCPRQLCVMIHSLKALKYGMMGLHQSDSEFTKKIPFQDKGNLGTIWAKIMQLYVS